MAQSSTLVCGAQLSPQWSETCLCYTWKVVYSILLGPFDICLDTLMSSGEFAQELIYGQSHFADRAVLITWADILGGSACQTSLL